MDNLTDKEQKELCKFCEDFIIECKSSTQTFLCEGNFCEEALEKLKEFNKEK